MPYNRGEIDTFPFDTKGYKKYDIVYFGELLQNFEHSEVGKLLLNKYVFLFSTKLNINKDSEFYGQVNIDLVKHHQLSYFNQHLRDKANYFIVGKEPIIINNFIEIIPEETEQGIQVVAILRSQNKINTFGKSTKRYRILLIRANKRFDNLPRLELGPEFQSKVEHDKAKERLYKLLDCTSIISNLAKLNKDKPTEGNAFEIVKESLNKEIEYQKQEINRTFDNYFAYKQILEYIHKE